MPGYGDPEYARTSFYFLVKMTVPVFVVRGPEGTEAAANLNAGAILSPSRG